MSTKNHTGIHHTAQIHSGVKIGTRVTIGPYCVIGFPGFGYEENAFGEWHAKPHKYTVMIGDDVEIGANTCIDRGSWRDTLIGRGTKIDNLVHIAHNVHVGMDCIIVAQVGLGGSVTVEGGAWIGFGAHVNQRLRIGKRAYVGTGAVVVKDVPDEMVVAGVPARILRRREERDK